MSVKITATVPSGPMELRGTVEAVADAMHYLSVMPDIIAALQRIAGEAQCTTISNGVRLSNAATLTAIGSYARAALRKATS